MRSQAFEDILRPVRFVHTVMWLTLMGSVGIYVVVAYVMAQPADGGDALPQAAEYALSAAALASAVAAVLVPRAMLSDARLREHMTSEEFSLSRFAVDPRSGRADQSRLERLQKLPEHEQRLATVPALYLVPFIVGMALSEAVAIFGLVMAIVEKRFDYIVPFAVVAVGLMALKKPNVDEAIDRAERHSGGPGAAGVAH